MRFNDKKKIRDDDNLSSGASADDAQDFVLFTPVSTIGKLIDKINSADTTLTLAEIEALTSYL